MRLSVIVPATDSRATLTACIDAVNGALEAPEEVIVVGEPPDASAAEARNLGAARASGEALVFVDSDVVVHLDAFVRLRRALESNPDVAAVFGSYDDVPATRGVVSAFRNLLHHHVHHEGAGYVSTFWSGLGAVRTEAFREVGGFDPSWAFMEDVDLGMRLTRRHTILLDPTIQGTHLKEWTLLEMVRNDFSRRGIPWVLMLLDERSLPAELNLGWRHRASAAASLALVGGAVSRKPRIAVAALLTLLALNAPFYGLLARRRGPREAALGVGLHALHHLAGIAAIPAAVAVRLNGAPVRRAERT